MLIRQGGTQRLEKRLLAERFAQKSRSTSLKRLDMNIVTIICSDENDRNSVISSRQPAL